MRDISSREEDVCEKRICLQSEKLATLVKKLHSPRHLPKNILRLGPLPSWNVNTCM